MRNLAGSPRMKYSAFISPNRPSRKPQRESEAPIISNRSSYYISERSVSTKKSMPKDMLASSMRLATEHVSPNRDSKVERRKENIQLLMRQLKQKYPLQKPEGKINRAKSQEYVLGGGATSKKCQIKTQIQEIQQKLSSYRKNKLKASECSPEKMLSPNKSPSKVGLAAQKCKQLCLSLKNIVLKETVSTTTTEHREPRLKIGDFDMGKQIGKGKFSRVYLAQHKITGFLCAVKTIKKETIRREKFQNQLTREIVVQSFFEHVNIVQLYGVFSDRVNIYLVMEYCPGGQLYDIFKVKSKLRDEEWKPIMKGICEGLFSLHLNDVIHRDLKPENVLMAFGLPKLGDFGWAVHSPRESRQTFCGTPLYISPELLTGSSYDKQVDIWALGIMMYEFVTGRIPFRLDSSKKLAQIVTSDIEFPSTLSSGCRDLLMMILDKDPLNRLGILDILEHPYIKNSLSGSCRTNQFTRSGR